MKEFFEGKFVIGSTVTAIEDVDGYETLKKIVLERSMTPLEGMPESNQVVFYTQRKDILRNLEIGRKYSILIGPIDDDEEE